MLSILIKDSLKTSIAFLVRSLGGAGDGEEYVDDEDDDDDVKAVEEYD